MVKTIPCLPSVEPRLLAVSGVACHFSWSGSGHRFTHLLVTLVFRYKKCRGNWTNNPNIHIHHINWIRVPYIISYSVYIYVTITQSTSWSFYYLYICMYIVLGLFPPDFYSLIMMCSTNRSTPQCHAPFIRKKAATLQYRCVWRLFLQQPGNKTQGTSSQGDGPTRHRSEVQEVNRFHCYVTVLKKGLHFPTLQRL